MIKLLELFGGIGACSKALDRLGIDGSLLECFNSIYSDCDNINPVELSKLNSDKKYDYIKVN